MSKGIKYKGSHPTYYLRKPWAKFIGYILSRCNDKKRGYYKKGIRNFLTVDDLKYLWFRDKAYLLKHPSIDRINSSQHYTLDNCRYIELWDNVISGKNIRSIKQINIKNGKIIKIWRSISEAVRKTKVNERNLYHHLYKRIPGRRYTVNGYRWEFVNNQEGAGK